MTVTRLRICKYDTLLQYNLRVVHLVCGYNQNTISYYLFVDRKGSDETAHLRSLVWAFSGRLFDTNQQAEFNLYFISSYILKYFCPNIQVWECCQTVCMLLSAAARHRSVM